MYVQNKVLNSATNHTFDLHEPNIDHNRLKMGDILHLNSRNLSLNYLNS